MSPLTQPPALVDQPRAAFAVDLAAHGERPALIHDGAEITYSDLAARVDALRAALGTVRRFVLLEAANHPDAVAAYLACLSGGHPVLLTAPGGPQTEGLIDAYDPDVAIRRRGDRWIVSERHAEPVHDLHPDLALLLSTSGSTGAPKLVRLSHRNLTSNARSIAEYLDIGDADRAVTSLPMQYCYGLSVINSHLERGGALVLTETSVVDPCFWDAVRSSGATSFAGVPHTFDLLARAGFEHMSLPHLRYITQAGGRMAPETVRRYARLGRERGWDLVVMYGQTEATARIAYLPPELAEANPASIGRPVPGGSLHLDLAAGDGSEVGELVYTGPNVMMGYAESPADLALGAVVDELRTGDLARRSEAGLYEVVGRRRRFSKLFGLRIDLDQLERILDDSGIEALCDGDDRRVLVGVVGGSDEAESAATVVRDAVGLPRAAVRAVPLARLPRLPTGKPDRQSLGRLAGDDGEPTDPAPRSGGDTPDEAIRRVFRTVLHLRTVDDADTFVSLGGDSLSYVEMSIRLEEILGELPEGWHLVPIGQLAAGPDRGRRLATRLETGLVLRAVAITLIVGTHAQVFELRGGAHVLLAVAGFNFARFQLASGHLVRSVLRVAVPTVAWIGGLLLLTDDHSPLDLLLANNVIGDPTWSPRWHYWFIEVLVQVLVVAAVALTFPPARRAVERWPFGVPAALLALSIAPIVAVSSLADTSRHLARPHLVAWLFLLGWAAERSRTTPQRVLLSVAVAAAVPGFFGHPVRDAIVAVGLLALVWLPHVTVVRPVNRLVGVLAGASLYIYLTHWQVYPPVVDALGPPAALAASLVVGVLVHTLVRPLALRIERYATSRAASTASTVSDTASRVSMTTTSSSSAPGGSSVAS